MRNNTLLFLFLMGWNLLPAQSASLDPISEKLNSFQKHYVYPSVLRALGGMQGNSFNDFVSDIELIRILKLDSSFVLENDSLISESFKNLEGEHFEFLGSVRDKENLNEFFVHEKEERILGFLLYRKEEHSYLIIELVGNIHIKKLNDLMNIDYESFNFLIE